jgi:hypothetical protein
MRLPWMKAIASFLFSATLSAPAWANANANSAVPGTLNYVEGKVSMGGETLDSKSIGSAELKAGQSLTTGSGKAEVLLTPGVFLRLGDNSTVTMISPGLTDTVVGIERGRAMLEVEEIRPENDIRVTEDGATTRILKTGLYDFDSDAGWVRVYDGKATVEEGGRQVNVKGGREVDFAPNGALKANKFDKKADEEGDLYRWSSLRSGYVAEANVDAARLYAASGFGPGPGGAGWWGAGWYWDPWFDGFTFIPGDGIFYSSFGWGFYSPWWVYDAPFFGYGYGYQHFHHHFSPDVRSWGPGSHYVAGRNYSGGVYRGPGSVGRGFQSGPGMTGGSRGSGGSRGGGFESGGFHGGGGFGGGGSHGGGGAHGR